MPRGYVEQALPAEAFAAAGGEIPLGSRTRMALARAPAMPRPIGGRARAGCRSPRATKKRDTMIPPHTPIRAAGHKNSLRPRPFRRCTRPRLVVVGQVVEAHGPGADVEG